MRKMVVAAVVAVLVLGMMIPGTSIWKTQAQKEYEGWTEVEWTDSAEILMGSLTYGMKINVPTEEIREVTVGTDYNPESFKENGVFNALVSYELGGEKYSFAMLVWSTEHFETISMRDKALENKLDDYRNKWIHTWISDKNLRWDIYYEKGSPRIRNTTHMVAHLFDMALEEETVEETIEQLNQSKIPNELKSAFKSNNSSLSAEAVVAQTSAENYWFISDGIKTYAVWKNEDQLNVWSCCKRINILLKNEKGTAHGIASLIIKGPVIYNFYCIGHDVIWDEMMKKYWDPMLRSFQPIVEIT